MIGAQPSLLSQRHFAKWALLLLTIVFVSIYLLPLGSRPLVVPDEARYGVIPAEMIDTGEWVVPHLSGIRYFEKPVLGYWMTAVSFLAFGENAFALRLPAALMTGFAIAAIVLVVRRWTNRWDIAALAGVVLATCLEPALLGTTAVLDAPFSALITLTVACFYLAWRASGPARYGLLVAAGVACGAAFLVKGFLAIALPGMILAPWLAWSGRWRDLLTLPWIPAAAAVLTVLPWSWAVHGRAPEFWHYFFWVEHVHRFTGGDKAQHPESWWFFVPIMFIGLIPWVFAAPFAIRGLLWRGFGSAESRLLLCWLIIPLLFFSVSSGKLPTYILPCFPPAAALLAVGLVGYFDAIKPRGRLSELVPGGILIAIGLVAVACWPFVPTEQVDGGPWQDGGTWRISLLGAALVLWGLADWKSNRTHDGRSRVLIGGLAVAVFFSMMPMLMPTGWMTIAKSPVSWLTPWRPLAERSTVLAGRDFIHAAGWTWPDAEIRLFGEPGEMRWGVENFEEHATSHVTRDEFTDVVQQATDDRPIMLVATDPERYVEWINVLVRTGAIKQPAITTDRNVVLAVWPQSAGIRIDNQKSLDH
jgi:4-amino-4-deoxy-L-arabinose transferase